MGILNNGLE